MNQLYICENKKFTVEDEVAIDFIALVKREYNLVLKHFRISFEIQLIQRFRYVQLSSLSGNTAKICFLTSNSTHASSMVLT